MNDADKFWQERSNQLRRFKGLHRLSMEEAEEALKKIPFRKASDEEVDSIIDAISIPGSDCSPPIDWSPVCNYSEIDCEAALFRGEGESSPETDRLEDELLEELLDDDEPEDDTAGLEN